MPILRTTIDRARRFVELDSGRRRLLIEAAIWLAVARVLLRVRSFRALAPRLGTVRRPDEARALCSAPGAPEDAVTAAEIGWAVTRAARHLPFEAVCLPRAMAAKRMLRRRRIVGGLYFGMAKGDDGAMQIHAWLLAGGVKVTGYPEADAFTPIACYV